MNLNELIENHTKAFLKDESDNKKIYSFLISNSLLKVSIDICLECKMIEYYLKFNEKEYFIGSILIHNFYSDTFNNCSTVSYAIKSLIEDFKNQLMKLEV